MKTLFTLNVMQTAGLFLKPENSILSSLISCDKWQICLPLTKLELKLLESINRGNWLRFSEQPWDLKIAECPLYSAIFVLKKPQQISYFFSSIPLPGSSCIFWSLISLYRLYFPTFSFACMISSLYVCLELF